MFLSGSAIENYAKGIILNTEPNLAKGGKLAGWGHHGHDCQKLVARTKINLSPDEDDTLRRLKGYVVWYGRYPTPNNYEGDLPVPGGGGSRRPADFICIDSICAKLRERLAKIAGV
jgi:hypothetical protein